MPGEGGRLGRVRSGEEALGPGPSLQCALSAVIRGDQESGDQEVMTTSSSKLVFIIDNVDLDFICDIA